MKIPFSLYCIITISPHCSFEEVSTTSPNTLLASLFTIMATTIAHKTSPVGQPNFFGISASMSTVDIWPNRGWTPIFSQFGSRLTTSRRLRRSEGRSELALPRDLRSLRDVVKQLPNWLKIGVQPRFGQTSTVEFEAFFQKKFGQA